MRLITQQRNDCRSSWNKQQTSKFCTHYSLPPVSEGWMFSQVSVCPRGGGGGQGREDKVLLPPLTPPSPSQDRGPKQPGQGTPPPSPPDRARVAVRRGRYDSCVYAGGLS